MRRSTIKTAGRLFLTLPALLLLTACVALPMETPNPTPEPTLTPPPPAVEMVTPDPVPTPTVATLLICGDAMAHGDLSRDALDPATGEYDYSHLFTAAAPYAQAADYAVVNLEAPLAGGTPTGYPKFSAADAMAQNLKEGGFDL
ncbi:MAG: CapA family protein [Oscillospiraceae bacterium]|nr:CapA family protein [Oscillospiraceae bacterium]